MLRSIFFLLAVVSLINAQVSEDMLCEGRVFEPSCTTGTIRIVSATYGKTDSWFCGGMVQQPSWNTNCASDVSSNVRNACQGKSSCSVLVTGQDTCAGNSKYLQVIWSCDTGVIQSSSGNQNSNIFVSTSPKRTNPIALHGQSVAGSLYVFLSPATNVSQVRWYFDATDHVFTTETVSPWDLLGGRPWDTLGTRIPDGQHRLIASMTFTDGRTGYIDAIFLLKNGVAPRNAAVEKIASSFFDNTTDVSTAEPSTVVPWSLFGVSCGVVVILFVGLIVISNKTPPLERA